MSTGAGTSKPAIVPRRHPRLEQAQRTWYLFRRNTLALVGLGILLVIALIAVYAVTQPLNWLQMPVYCSADYGPANAAASGYPHNYTISNQPGCSHVVCTYEVVPPPNPQASCDGKWYKTPYFGNNISYPQYVAPTVTVVPFTSGPLPLGALTVGGSSYYDISNGLLRGSDWSLIFSLSIVGAGALIGLVVGAIAGYLGGVVDDFLMRLVDIFLSIPQLLFVVVVVAVGTTAVSNIGNLGPSYTKLLMLTLGFIVVWWPFYSRLVRSQVLVVREQKYVEAARASGASKGRILLRHIVPNSVYPIFIQFSLDVGTIPLLIGSLVFLGFGPSFFPSNYFPEWGAIAAISVGHIAQILDTCYDIAGCVIPWWQFLFPGLALFFFAISVNLLSDGLRDSLDPRLRR